MIIGLLQADPVYPELRAQFGDYPRMFRDLFGRIETEVPISYVTYDVELEEYPSRLDLCDAYLITGSKASVNDDEPWIRRLEEFIRACHFAFKPLIGICFGHQLIAKALGGRVRTAKVGWGVGVHTCRIVQNADFMVPSLRNLSLLVSHRDQVTRLPSEAQLLASSEFCPIAAYRIGDHIYAQQSHPEFTRGYARGLLEMRRELLGDETCSRALDSMAKETDEETAARWILNFLSDEVLKESARER